eukprot:COSAG02_NODE_2286_length_9213_cov_149.155914_6_plen_278_part_00
MLVGQQPGMATKVAPAAFAELAGCFDQRVRELQGCASLLHTATYDEQLQSIGRSLTAVEASFDALRGAVEAEKHCLRHADAVAIRAKEQASLLAKIISALPKELLQDQPLAPRSDSSSNTAKRPKSAQKQQQRPKPARKRPAAPAPVPDAALEHVTQSELDGLRRDVKGRLTVEKLNTGIDELQQLMAVKKQLLLHKRPSTLKHGDAQRVKDWRALVTAETEGYAFFTENDLLDPPGGSKPSSTMVGATGKSLISALRSLGRVKEVRVKRTKLYLVL